MGNLVIKWGRGGGVQAIYNGEKVGACSGGGYDKKGTVIGQFLQSKFQDRLIKLLAPEIEEMKNQPFEVELDNRNRTRSWRSHETHENKISRYGVYINEYKTVIKKTGEEKTEIKIGLDGAVGSNCMERLAKEIGVKLNYAGGTRSVDTYYVEVSDFPVQENK